MLELADSRKVDKGLDAGSVEHFLRAHAAQLQQLGGMNCAYRHQNLLANLDGGDAPSFRVELNTSGGGALEEHPLNGRLGHEMVVGTVKMVAVMGVGCIGSLQLDWVHESRIPVNLT